MNTISLAVVGVATKDQGLTKKPTDDDALDRDAYSRADDHFRMVRSRLPQRDVEAVAREVVRRLAFHLPRTRRPGQLPSKAEIAALVHALLSSDELAGEQLILRARREGSSIETIYLGYVAGAARLLGEMWENDTVSFMDVTLASGRLYRIIRGLRHVLDAALHGEDDEQRALFALVPEETHTLGIEIATDLFRRAGWDVDLSVGEDEDMVVARAEQQRYRAIVLVANNQEMLPNLISLVLAMRLTQPMAHVIVAGNIVTQVPEVDDLVGADHLIHDIEGSVGRLEAIVAHD